MKYSSLILLMAGGCLLSACGASPAQADTAAVSDTAEKSAEDTGFPRRQSFSNLKSFTAKTLDGGTFTEADWAQADVTAINIWSTTCGPCIREMPDLAEYANSLPENLRVMTWCLDAEFSPAADSIAEFLSDCGYTGITLTSGDGDLETLYGQLLYTPTTIFVDGEGNLVGEPIVGAGDIEIKYDAQFQAALAELDLAETAES